MDELESPVSASPLVDELESPVSVSPPVNKLESRASASPLVDELESRARQLLPAPVYAYVSQGSGRGISAAEAQRAWCSFRFRPRVLRDVTTVTTATTVLGTRLGAPLAIAPTTLQRHAHPDGESEMARGGAVAGSLVCVSSNAGQPFARIAASGCPWWVQAYVLADRTRTASMLERAVAAAASAVVLTVDTPIVASKTSLSAAVWEITPEDFLHANEEIDGTHLDVAKARDLTARDIGWVGELTGLPVVVKGVLRADDAVSAVGAGAAAVWVSNHGGRQLDRAVATAYALADVVDAVDGRAEVYVDGGIRSGADVFAALALGARTAFVGRPAVWALACGGASGAAELLRRLGEEFAEAMVLSGVRSPGDFGRDLLWPSR